MSLNFKFTEKGPERTYEERTCEANPAGENSLFMSTAVSNLFHFIILSLPRMLFYIWLSKNFSKPTSKNGEIGHFYRSLLTESF